MRRPPFQAPDALISLSDQVPAMIPEAGSPFGLKASEVISTAPCGEVFPRAYAGFPELHGPLLVLAHHAAVIGDVGHEDRRQPAFDRLGVFRQSVVFHGEV